MATRKSTTVKTRAIHRAAVLFFIKIRMTAPKSGKNVTMLKIGIPILLCTASITSSPNYYGKYKDDHHDPHNHTYGIVLYLSCLYTPYPCTQRHYDIGYAVHCLIY